MSENAGFQISLDIQGRLCVAIGGDDETFEKVSRLLDVGAKVIVVNPTLTTALKKLTASGKIIHRGRHFRSTDAQDAFLVLNLLREDTDLSKSLFELAKTERFLVWSIDQPDRSHFMMPALIKSGPLRVAISTSGASPALASELRRYGESIFDEEFGQFLDSLSALREELKKSEPNDARRRERLKEAVEGFRFTGTITYPASWEAQKKLSAS
ncbi:bifunctional precorrin-2 dehydrogenase/sirohydrochlorin ferrochelatase [Candidatus Nitronereus thalassa]|uniref:precorrin-2 dehydrogenase n=1 Tax=Candidatus Nitronereus thalassa TaxID=3020898 RepID=A0ABU3K4T1_9BACT|nr:bifunctional precorrin-2 dehydrogenase/sirohydrochlorin ferrochelatase [Candidatus Nitronereus thalassa]MDT7041412.1 bifunctional precorrin-2 dehydrogenase/sirohydrochlorin ferrochelatase [Candidatus Nitronereus thalassa]